MVNDWLGETNEIKVMIISSPGDRMMESGLRYIDLGNSYAVVGLDLPRGKEHVGGQDRLLRVMPMWEKDEG